MAPKQRKSTPARNPPRGFGSSSSNPPIPSDIQFHDEKAKTDFFENFQNHGIHSKRLVILSDFSDITLPDVIRTQGWESLCEKLVCYLVVFIQEFYSNIHGIDTSMPQFATRFRGTRIVVTSDLVAEVLRVLKVAHPNYPGCDRLWTVSRDEPISHFCGTPSIWGG